MSSIDNRNPLIERARIRGASRMIAEGRDAASITKDEWQQVAADVEVFRHAQKPILSKLKIATETGYSPGVISEFIAGSYKGNNGQVAIDLESWLCAAEEKARKPEVNQYVDTNVALEMKATAEYCLEEHSIGLVFSPESSGFGKTTVLQAIYQTLGPRKCAMCTVDKVDANPTGLLKKLCQSLRIDDTGTNKQRFDRIVAKIDGRDFIFLIDQIHNLRWSKDHKPFYILTDLFDRTKAAQLWVGTADLVKYLKNQQNKALDESLAQIRSRIYPQIDLVETLASPIYVGNGTDPMVATVEQVREMFAKNRLKLTPGSMRFICRLCNKSDSGSIRLAVNIVKYATMHAELIRRTAIDVDLLVEALRKGLTTDRADVLLKELDMPAPARAAQAG